VNGCIDDFHLLLPDDGIAFLNLVQKIGVVLQWNEGRYCGVLRNVLQLFEHDAQMRQQRVRGCKPEMLAHNVSFRIGVSAGARFGHKHLLVQVAQHAQHVNRGFGEGVEHLQYEMPPRFLQGQRKPHFRGQQARHHGFLIVEIARKIKPAVGGYEVACVLVFGHAMIKVAQ